MAEIRAGRPSFKNNPDKIALNEPTSGPQSQSHPSGVLIPPINPIGIGNGGSDLFPGAGAGMYPSRGYFGGGGGGGGMLLGPNDTRWFGGFPAGAQQAGVPAGARFDPYGPPGVPGFEPNRFLRNPSRAAGAGNHPHPDQLEHFEASDFKFDSNNSTP